MHVVAYAVVMGLAGGFVIVSSFLSGVTVTAGRISERFRERPRPHGPPSAVGPLLLAESVARRNRMCNFYVLTVMVILLRWARGSLSFRNPSERVQTG